ncbi:MAG TPA: hypothetical protein G4O02_04840 [Caldilineae bacterium]|nr:hypothetical protein [Caldilineae bacterium]
MELPPEMAEEADPLMELARELAEVLQPVRPREAYRAHLHRGLVEAAQRKLARQAAAGHPQRIPRRQWMLGAAAVGSAVSVLGVIAYLIHSRHSSRARQVLPS